MLSKYFLTRRVSSSYTPVNKFHKWFIKILLLLAVSQGCLTASVSSISTSTPPTIHSQQRSNDNTNCPEFCTCIYESPIHHLKISCNRPTSSSKNDEYGEDVRTIKKLLVKILTITNSVVDPFTLSQINQTIQQDNLLEINIYQTVLDPIDFLSSDIFRLSIGSLRKLSFVEITSSKSFSLPRGVKVKYFSELRHLENLSVQDCDAWLSNLILKTLPASHHISIVRSSVDYLNAEHFSQLSELRSLNLSSNKIESIPYGLLKNLPHLQVLDISHNVIEHLQEEIFVGLFALKVLNVGYNKIRYVDTEVFNPLKSAEIIDLSHNEIIQIFEPYFQENKKLKILRMKNSWSWHSFIDQYKASRSFTEMERLIATLSAVEILDLSDNEMVNIPETLSHVPQLKQVSLRGNPWECSCQDRWVPFWIKSTNVSIVEDDNPSTIFCHSSTESGKFQYQFTSYMKSLNCTNPNITARTPFKYYGIAGRNTLLQCHSQANNIPTITWITPSKRKLASGTDNNTTFLVDSNLIVLESGDLFIADIDLADFGLYLCIASYPGLSITHYIHLGMDTSIFLDVKIASILVGLLTSFCFLFTVLTVQLVRLLLGRCGVECFSLSGPSTTRRVRAFFDSIEKTNTTQMDWLRDNYNMQANRIKDNCMAQLERIRESYTSQTKNLSDIKYYGAQQLHTIRDQYYDQIRRVSSYSSQHLCKVRENYVFQRNRVTKFSSHQMLRLRETYKWQAQNLNKILENLPKTFDTCRGMGGRADSMYLDETGELRPVDVLFGSGGFDNIQYADGSSQRMEHFSLLIPPSHMQKLGQTLQPKFSLPENSEETELVMVITKTTTDIPSANAGAVNENVVIEDEVENKMDHGDVKC